MARSRVESRALPSLVGLVSIATLAFGCGRTEVSDRPSSSAANAPDRSCLELCLEVEPALRETFLVPNPCSERAWTTTALDCAACGRLFADFYGVSLETSACRDCRGEVPPVACGLPPPDCALGLRPEIEPCKGACPECSPSFSGNCVPCD